MKKYYTFYREDTEEIVAFGTADQCIKKLRIKNINSFYSLVSRVKSGKNKKYKVVVEDYELK